VSDDDDRPPAIRALDWHAQRAAAVEAGSRSSFDRPHFLIVCDHGHRGDHAECDHRTGCRLVDPVATLPWFPGSQQWWAAEAVNTDTVIVWPRTGDAEVGSDPWAVQGDPEPEGGDPNYESIDIRCRAADCRTWDLRCANDEALQRVLNGVIDLIVTRPDFAAVYAPSVNNSRIVVTLQGLHVAQKHVTAR
jgi:hypothetical protein